MAEPVKHVWLNAEFSVRAETLCMRPKTVLPVGANWRTATRQETGSLCLLGLGHGGRCKFTDAPDVRLYGFREGR
jgi:hypothetical protein